MARRSELARRVVIEPWPEGGIEFELEADPEERAALARRFDLLELRSLTAHGALERSADRREIRLRGQLMADVVQTCVVSLEPVAATVSAPFERRYFRLARGEELPEPDETIDLQDEEAEIEPLRTGSIEIGEVLAEELGLVLDPYPRRPDAYEQLPELGPHVSLGEPEPEPAESPFAALGQLYHPDKRAR